jgi:hypothetical protein
MSVLFLAAAIYLYLFFLGWGLTRIALPRTLSQYRAWFAPWTGIMLAAIMGVHLSRLGIGAIVTLYSITAVGAGFGILSVLPKLRPLPTRSVPRTAFMFGFLATLLLALYPLLCLHDGPTTVSLGNSDPVTYATTARFLETGSIRHPPVCDVSRPLTCQVNHLIVWNSRPGTYLLISLLAGLFHLQTYEILTVLLAVVLALTPPLVGIFVKVVSGNRLAALIALLMSALSVNQLYFFYHGFAGQIFGEGCLVIAFTLLWKAEGDQKHWSSYAFMMGLTISGMLELYQEDVPLFFIPLSIYFVLQLVAKMPRWRLACRYALLVGTAFFLDPFAFWYCLVWLWTLRTTTVFGWPMPRWALPADVIGLMNVYLPGVSERGAAIASIPVACLALCGFLYWRKPRLTLSVASAALGLLLYECEILDYSYAYHKFADTLSFLLIGAFATGGARAIKGRAGFLVRRYAASAAVTFLAMGCFLTAIPLIKEMKRAQLSVSPDLVELTTIKQLADKRAIRLVEDRAWQQLWAVYFLEPRPILLDKPSAFLARWIHTASPVSQNVLTLVPKSPEASSTEYFTLPERAASSADQVALIPNTIDPSLTVAPGPEQTRIRWQNSSYLLLGPGPQHQSLRLSGQTPDKWITSEGLTLDVPGKWVRLRPIIQLSGQAVFFEHLGGKLNVSAKLHLAERPRGEVPATIEASAGHYALRIILNAAELPSDGEVHLTISFDKYFVPEQFGYNSDTRRLVIVMPEEVRLLSQAR